MICPSATVGDARGLLAGAPRREGGRARPGRRPLGHDPTVVLPFGRGGIIGGSMLASGRRWARRSSVALIIYAAFDPSRSAHAADRRQLDRRVHRVPLRRVEPSARATGPDGRGAGVVCDHASVNTVPRWSCAALAPARGWRSDGRCRRPLITAALACRGQDVPDGPSRPGAFTASDVAAVVGVGGERVRAGVACLLQADAGRRREPPDSACAGSSRSWRSTVVTFELDGRVIGRRWLMAALIGYRQRSRW